MGYGENDPNYQKRLMWLLMPDKFHESELNRIRRERIKAEQARGDANGAWGNGC